MALTVRLEPAFPDASDPVGTLPGDDNVNFFVTLDMNRAMVSPISTRWYVALNDMLYKGTLIYSRQFHELKMQTDSQKLWKANLTQDDILLLEAASAQRESALENPTTRFTNKQMLPIELMEQRLALTIAPPEEDQYSRLALSR